MAKVAKRTGVAAAGIAAGLAYAGPLRRWMRNWGATPEEIERALPGDHILSGDVDQTTRAITIEAKPEAIWPWLAQMGDHRGGFYGGETLFRLFGLQHGHSAERISPELQDLHEGGRVPAGWTGFDVRRVDPNRTLVLSRSGSGYEYTWCIALEPASDTTTRLVSRVRYRGSKAIHAISEPIVFGMMRRWFTTVKARAERGQRPEAIERAGPGGDGGAHP
jgi:hypothetical protein